MINRWATVESDVLFSFLELSVTASFNEDGPKVYVGDTDITDELTDDEIEVLFDEYRELGGQ